MTLRLPWVDSDYLEDVAELHYTDLLPHKIELLRTDMGFEVIEGENCYWALLDMAYDNFRVDECVIVEPDEVYGLENFHRKSKKYKFTKIGEGIRFRYLMNSHHLSPEDLAVELGIPVETIIDSQEYCQASESRNGYLDYWQNQLCHVINNLDVGQVKYLNSLPLEMGDLWLVNEALNEDKPTQDYDKFLISLLPLLGTKNVKDAANTLNRIEGYLRLWGYIPEPDDRKPLWLQSYDGGLILPSEDALPYLKCLMNSRWFVNGAYDLSFIRDILETICIPLESKAHIVLSLEKFQDCLDSPCLGNLLDLKSRLQEEARVHFLIYKENEDFWIGQLSSVMPDQYKDREADPINDYKKWQEYRQNSRVNSGIYIHLVSVILPIIKSSEHIKSPLFRKVREYPGGKVDISIIKSPQIRLELLDMLKVHIRLLVEQFQIDRMSMMNETGEDGVKAKATNLNIDHLGPVISLVNALDDEELVKILDMLNNWDLPKIRFHLCNAKEPNKTGGRRIITY